MPDLTFKIISDFASDGIDKAKSSVSGLGDAANDAKGKLDSTGKSLDDIDSSAGKASGGGLGSLTSSLGGVAGAASLLAGAGGLGAVAGVMDASIDKVSSLAESTEKLSVAMGDTPEHASQMLFAFSQMGLNSDDATRDLDKFSKGLSGLVENEDGTTTKSNALTDQLKQMGITTQDSAGKALPMQQVLGQLADQFKTMPDGPEKTALAMQLFGKSGAELLPFLDQGSAGLDQLYKKSDQLGLTLNGSTIDAVHNATQAHREFSAAVDGLEVQLGTALMPAVGAAAQGLASFGVWMSTTGVPAIKDFASWIGDHLQPVFKALGDWVSGTFLPAWNTDFTSISAAVGAVVQFVQDHWDGIHAIIAPALDILTTIISSTFDNAKTVVETTIKAIQDIIKITTDLITGDWSGAWDGVKQLFSDVWDGIKSILSTDLTMIATVLSDEWTIIKTVLGDAWDGMKQKISDTITAVLGEIQALPGQIVSALGDLAGLLVNAGIQLIQGLEQGIISEAKNLPGQVGGAVQGAINSIPGIGGLASHIPGLASGGIVNQPTIAIIGENEPEAVIPLSMISGVQPPDLSGLPNVVSSGGSASTGHSGAFTPGDYRPGAGPSDSVVHDHAQGELQGTTPSAIAAQRTAQNTDTWIGQGAVFTPAIQAVAQAVAPGGSLVDAIRGANAAAEATIAAGTATAKQMQGVNVGSGGVSAGGFYNGFGGNSGIPLPSDPYGGGAGVARYASGGVINEPISGIGASGRRYLFGEAGPETVTPGAGGGGGVNITINISTLDAAGMQSIMPELLYQIQQAARQSGMTPNQLVGMAA